MVEVEFNYQQNKIIILANLEDILESILNKYVNKSKLDINKIYFISNGKNINKKDKLVNIMSESDKKNKHIIILVYFINNIINIKNTNIKKSNDIICPECKEICEYQMYDYRIKLHNCKNGHIIKNIKINEFENNQNLDISQIICDKCKNKSKANTFNNEFYICYECKMNLCPLCKSIHDKKHSIINYDNKNYICNKHNSLFTRYCKKCNLDICLSCSYEHKNHKIEPYSYKFIDIKKLRKKMNEFENVINKLKINLEEIMNKFKKIIENMNIIYNINNNILTNYENKKINHTLLSNLESMEFFIDNEISNIRDDYDFGYNLNSLLYLYSEMEEENKEIEIIYKPITKENEKVRIFGSYFVDNNIYKCKIKDDDTIFDLKEYYNDINDEYNNKDEIKIKLIGINNITNMSSMFNQCNSLFSLPNISKWNTFNVNSMSGMFCGCNLLMSLPDISNLITSNVISMSGMFKGCNSLSSLPDISKWDTSNVTSMMFMFNKCNSLSSLPDISKWNTSNVNSMDWMFNGCNSLSSLPDISKWNTSVDIDVWAMFSGCNLLLNIPSKFK